jgi:protein farnesyltransferase/geranylgeranyltransferase type-1 subunit alpha
MDEFCESNPKNYQIWFHRRAIAIKIGPQVMARELDFIDQVIQEDAKNYHAWAHRQFLNLLFNHWEGEEECITTCLQQDIRNNSAWNHVCLSYYLYYALLF